MNILIEFDDDLDDPANPLAQLVKESKRILMLKNKYRTLWELRHLEQKIDSANARMMITKENTFQVSCENENLQDEIEKIVRNMKPD